MKTSVSVLSQLLPVADPAGCIMTILKVSEKKEMLIRWYRLV